MTWRLVWSDEREFSRIFQFQRFFSSKSNATLPCHHCQTRPRQRQASIINSTSILLFSVISFALLFLDSFDRRNAFAASPSYILPPESQGMSRKMQVTAMFNPKMCATQSEIENRREFDLSAICLERVFDNARLQCHISCRVIKSMS